MDHDLRHSDLGGPTTPPSSPESGDRPRSPRARRVRRWVLVAVALGAVAVLVLATGVALAARSVRRDLIEANAALRLGRDALVRDDPSAAESAFTDARAGFSRARAGVSGAWFQALGSIPIGGRTTDALAAIAQAGTRVADAGAKLSVAVEALPGGLGSLTPDAGRIPLERFGALADAASVARDEAAAALAGVEEAPRAFLVPPVGSARMEAEEQLRSLEGSLATGTDLLSGLPEFLGADGPRHYFFGAQNPAELRGTGGVMGAYSILTIDDGRFGFTDFGPIQSLPIPSLRDVRPPTTEFSDNYDEFRTGRRFWLAINLTPDFPTAARAILNAYDAVEGQRLDGVILADPFALEALLKVTGPSRIPGLGTTVGAADVVDFTTNGAYSVYPDPAIRKRVLGAVAQTVFAEFLSRSDNDVGDLRVLADAAAEGHIIAYSEDPTMQRGLVGTGAGGALDADPGADLFSVIENSAGGTKVDFFQERRISYQVDLWDEGAAEGSTELELTNDAPTSGQPVYVIGPDSGFAKVGEDVQLVTMYCVACRLEEAHRDGRRIAVSTGTEGGLTYYRDYFGTPSGTTRRLDMTWYIPDAWEGDAGGGRYRLLVFAQSTIRPTRLDVAITVPDGMHIESASPGMRIDGETAVFEGVAPHRLELEVRFAPSVLGRLWRAITP